MQGKDSDFNVIDIPKVTSEKEYFSKSYFGSLDIDDNISLKKKKSYTFFLNRRAVVTEATAALPSVGWSHARGHVIVPLPDGSGAPQSLRDGNAPSQHRHHVSKHPLGQAGGRLHPH